jgi:hypothetical protein
MVGPSRVRGEWHPRAWDVASGRGVGVRVHIRARSRPLTCCNQSRTDRRIEHQTASRSTAHPGGEVRGASVKHGGSSCLRFSPRQLASSERRTPRDHTTTQGFPRWHSRLGRRCATLPRPGRIFAVVRAATSAT